MKKVFLFIIIFLLAFNSCVYASPLELKGEAVLLIDGDSQRILYEKNLKEKMYPASTTKIMTAVLAIEYGKLDEMVLADEEIVNLTSGSHIALDYNELVEFEDLLNALLIASANDVALALAKHIAGSIDGFIEMMNQKAKEIGALNTNFTNPHGLHNDNHYSTAYDLYLITNYAMKYQLFRDIIAKSSYKIPPTNRKQVERIMHSTNKFLYGNEMIYVNDKLVPIKYDGMSGVKTGFTDKAGRCFIGYSNKENRNIYSIVLKSENSEVFADTIKLMDYAFNNFTNKIIGNKNEFIDNIDINKGTLPYASAVLEEDVYYTLSNKESGEIERKILITEDLIAPISKGDILGQVEFYLEGNLIGETNIISTLSIDLLGKIKFIRILLKRWYLVLIILWLIFRIYTLISRKLKKRRSKYYTYK